MPDLTFIETQFREQLSKESYKEKAGASQTLTGLGKWWGGTLVLCSCSFGTLMAGSDDPKKDRKFF
jgi:hypothetical protein